MGGMPSSSHNGVPKSSGASGSTVKAKPGTVAAALEAKKAAAQAEAASASKDSEAKNEAKIETNDDDNDEGTDEGSTKGGLTSEERVLLREKKKARLQKKKKNLKMTEIPLIKMK